MKRLSVVCFFALTLSPVFALTPAEKQGLQNIIEWANEQQAQLQTAQRSVTDLTTDNLTLRTQAKKKDDMIAWQAGQIDNLTLWGNKCEQAVKAITEVLAIALSLSIGTAFAGQILKNFPSIEGPVATVLLYLAVFLGTYYGVMTCIYAVAPYVPTIPTWHDISGWAAHLHKPKLP